MFFSFINFLQLSRIVEYNTILRDYYPVISYNTNISQPLFIKSVNKVPLYFKGASVSELLYGVPESYIEKVRKIKQKYPEMFSVLDYSQSVGMSGMALQNVFPDTTCVIKNREDYSLALFRDIDKKVTYLLKENIFKFESNHFDMITYLDCSPSALDILEFNRLLKNDGVLVLSNTFLIFGDTLLNYFKLVDKTDNLLFYKKLDY